MNMAEEIGSAADLGSKAADTLKQMKATVPQQNGVTPDLFLRTLHSCETRGVP